MAEATLSSTTAPGKSFSSRSELAEHYKSEWHKYNLKRREAGLAMLEEEDFQARWEAALALRKEKEANARSGTGHIKSTKKNKRATKNGEPIGAVATAATATTNEVAEAAGNPTDFVTSAETVTVTPEGQAHAKKMAESQENPDINPLQSLFDQHISETVEENVAYMQRKYDFFLPDKEYLADLEGLLGYCQEKIKLGHFCLYCDKVFPSWQACQKHMISKAHTKVRYEKGHWDELDVFYDFSRDDDGFLGPPIAERKDAAKSDNDDKMDIEAIAESGDEDDDDWEDMSDGEDEELYKGYEEEIARFGLDVTPLGELVFPDGRVVGHRALRKYYKQQVRSAPTGVAIASAKKAAGERLYEGRVVNISSAQPDRAHGVGKGILVRNPDGAEGFSTLSLYRYRAAVRKQRQGDDQGKRIKYKQSMNINKMGKKHNRLMNNVSVAHAKR